MIKAPNKILYSLFFGNLFESFKLSKTSLLSIKIKPEQKTKTI